MKKIDAVKFFKERIRICNSFEGSADCPLKPDCTDTDPELMVKAVEQWSQDHPQKTMMQDFFEKFPNAPKGKFNQPQLCPGNCGYNNEMASYEICKKFYSDCLKCWSRPLED